MGIRATIAARNVAMTLLPRTSAVAFLGSKARNRLPVVIFLEAKWNTLIGELLTQLWQLLVENCAHFRDVGIT